jgi:hypothetical protein
MNILKKGPKFIYTEKRNKNNKNAIECNMSGPIQEVIHNTVECGSALMHETNKHISTNFKKNYEQIKWDNKNNQIKSVTKELNKLTQIYKNN